MSRGKFYRRFPPRRKREGKTDYRKRVKLVKSGKPRLVVRRTNRYIIVQLVEPKAGGDRTIITITSKKLKDYGWRAGLKNTSAAYLTGLIAGRLASSRGIYEAIADIGRLRPVRGSRVFAAIKGAVDGGLSIPMDGSVEPAEDRIRGNHIAGYFRKIEGEEGRTQFSNLPAEVLKDLPAHFEEVKKTIFASL